MEKTKKLLMLENSLKKKMEKLDELFESHFEDVKRANGQPLNDKRSGQSTMNRWDRQSQSIRNLEDSIERTKRAIAIETDKILDCENVRKYLPEVILSLLESGKLVQWRKHPNTFFVAGVDKARIVWDYENKILGHRYSGTITDKDQWRIFAKTFNEIINALKVSEGA